MEVWLYSQHTPPKLILDILQLLTNWKQGIETVISTRHSPPIQTQIHLGNRHLIEGRITKHFSAFMDEHYASILSKKSGKRWSAMFIQKIWTLIHKPQWENRNTFVHKLNEEAVKTRLRENLQQELTTMYLSNLKETLLHNDRHLYDRSLSELLQSPNAHLMAWNEEMRVALSERDRQFQPDQQHQAAFMHKWLDRSRDRPPRQHQKKKRRVSTRVRKRISLLHHRQLKRQHPIPHSSDEESQPKRRKR